jgi:hypothetical protein
VTQKLQLEPCGVANLIVAKKYRVSLYRTSTEIRIRLSEDKCTVRRNNKNW